MVNSFRISLSGHYHVIYTDYYKSRGNLLIHDFTNGNDLFVIGLNQQTMWTPITINSIIPINVSNGFRHVDLHIRIQKGDRAVLNGSGYSSFYIRYLDA